MGSGTAGQLWESMMHTTFPEASEKGRENRLRRLAKRFGLVLMKSRRRDLNAIDYGGYMIVEPIRNIVVRGGSPWAYCLSLDDVEEYLTTE
jgi:hypothetical protein